MAGLNTVHTESKILSKEIRVGTKTPRDNSALGVENAGAGDAYGFAPVVSNGFNGGLLGGTPPPADIGPNGIGMDGGKGAVGVPMFIPGALELPDAGIELSGTSAMPPHWGHFAFLPALSSGVRNSFEQFGQRNSIGMV